MKKAIFASLFFVALPILAFSQTEQENKLERYYAGTGVKLWEVSENIIEFSGRRNGQEMRFYNKDGNFTGTVFFGQILENGPAARVGLESGDLLLEVDGESISVLGVDGAVQKITGKSVGDSVEFKVRQTDETGNTLREFNVNVVLELIDRVAWVYLDRELGGSLSGGDMSFSYSTQVSENKASGKFEYRYDLTNRGSETIVLRSTIFDLLLRKGSTDPTRYYLRLNPGKTSSFILESESFPLDMAPSPTRIFVKPDLELMKYFKDNYPDLESDEDKSYQDPNGELWLNTTGISMHLFVPVKWDITLLEENERFWKR